MSSSHQQLLRSLADPVSSSFSSGERSGSRSSSRSRPRLSTRTCRSPTLSRRRRHRAKRDNCSRFVRTSSTTSRSGSTSASSGRVSSLRPNTATKFASCCIACRRTWCVGGWRNRDELDPRLMFRTLRLSDDQGGHAFLVGTQASPRAADVRLQRGDLRGELPQSVSRDEADSSFAPAS